jgi:galactokinase
LSNQFQVSCAELDFLVDFAKESTAVIGSRMMGGGFGGCTINLVHKDELKKFKKKVRTAYAAKFNNECSIYKVKLSKGTYLVE